MENKTTLKRVIKNRGCGELMKNLCAMTGAVSYQLKPYHPVRGKTYNHLIYKLKKEGMIKTGKRSSMNKEKYYRLGELLMGESEELISGSGLGGYIERGEWEKLLKQRAKARQIALLSGAEVEGVRMVYKTDNFHNDTREDERIEGLMGRLPAKEGEGEALRGDIIDRIKNHDYPFGLFITSTELVAWLRYNPIFEDEKISRRLGQSKANGWLLTPGKDLYAVYIIDDIKYHKTNPGIERSVRSHIFERTLHTELKGLFVTTGGLKDKELLGKEKRRDADRDINPHLIKPVLVFDTYEIFDISEAADIQKITGTIPAK